MNDPRTQQRLQLIARNVRETRIQRGWSQTELAKRADVGLQTIVRLEAASPGTAVHTVVAVLDKLGALDHVACLLSPRGPMPSHPDKPPLHPKHIDDEDVVDAVERAAAAACEILDEIIPGRRLPESHGVNSNFHGHLERHLFAMLTGRPHYRCSYQVSLNRLFYSDADIPGESDADAGGDARGWVLRAQEGAKVLQDGRWLSLATEDFDAYSSREYALQGFRKELRAGTLSEPVVVVPVYLVADHWSFVPEAAFQSIDADAHDAKA